MISIIENTKSQAGYVVEEENYSSVALIYYEQRGKSFVPDLLETYSKEDIFELKNEAELRELFSDYVHSTDDIFFRESVDYLVPKA